MTVALVLWIVCAIFAAHIAGKRGGTGWLWLIIGFFAGPLAVLLAAVLPLSPSKPSEAPSFMRSPVSALAIIGICGAFLLVLFFANSPSRPVAIAETRRVTYLVNGSSNRASLTYRNQSGGTEQNTVQLPWTLELRLSPGAFAYVSAQNQEDGGTVHASVYLGGVTLQEATSGSAYGIATASARVP